MQALNENRISFLLGLPYVADNELLRTARRMGAPVLLSANAFAKRGRDTLGVPTFDGFNTAPLQHLSGMDACLDSAGFVAAVKYRGFDWTVEEYANLAATFPWRWAASMDWCVEPEVAGNEATVHDRISGTVRLNYACRTAFLDRGIGDRLMPVVQGWAPIDYLRCIDRMGDLLTGAKVVGIGSMCRRSLHGPRGILAVLDALESEFRGTATQFHLFGLKSDGMEAVRAHPRVASVDSQAYGVRARKLAMEANAGKRPGDEGFISKSNAFTAATMECWYAAQMKRIRKPGIWCGAPINGEIALLAPALDPIEAKIVAAREEIRQLHEAGEIDWPHVSDEAALAWAFDQDGEG
jgi:hypothetical protein